MIAIKSDMTSATLLDDQTQDKVFVTAMCDGQIAIEASGEPLVISPQMATAFAVMIKCIAQQARRSHLHSAGRDYV